MKIKILIAILIPVLIVLVFIGSCTTSSRTQDVEPAVISSSAQSLKETGKIYIKDNFLFVSELNMGVHVIDNQNPFKPEIIAFLKIPNNEDIAIRDNVLYADSHTDLIVIDISNPANISEIRRINNAFPEEYQFPLFFKILLLPLALLIGGAGSQDELAESPSTGKGGSLARFTIVDDYLYTITGSTLWLYNIEIPSNPTFWKQIEINWDIETIFPYEDKLFIGGSTGMYIYDNSNPADPFELSRFSHVTSCEPVVAEGNYAYVTLRGGSNCGGVEDSLEIIDISNIVFPRLIANYPMAGPYGLGIEGDSLFICDGEGGLKLFDASNPRKLRLIDHIYNIYPFDVILEDGLAVVVGKAGLYQYNYQDLENVELISKIPVY
jgi:hypothetical protein